MQKIESLIRKFWWGQKGERRKIHLVKWKTLCQSKSNRGMGFKDLALFYEALLAKQAWRLLHNKDSLFYRVFKAKFFPHCSIMEASDSTSSSYAWHSILKGHDVLLKGARRRVGCGESIGVWNYAWLPSLKQLRILSTPIDDFEKTMVCEFIDTVSRQWDLALLQGLFSSQEVELITSIPLCHNHVEDTLIWLYTHSGIYTVKSGYRFLINENSAQPITVNPNHGREVWKIIWGLNFPNEVKNFLWRFCKEAIPVKQILKRRKIIQDDKCDHCNLHAESSLHALWECPGISSAWDSVSELKLHQAQGLSSITDLVLHAHAEG